MIDHRPGPVTRWIVFGVVALVVYGYAVEALRDRFGFDMGDLAGFVIPLVILAAAGIMAARQVSTVRNAAITGAGGSFISAVSALVTDAGTLSSLTGDPGLAIGVSALIVLHSIPIMAAAGYVGGWAALRSRPPANSTPD